LQCSNTLIGKFEIGRGLFENFGKLEDGFSKFSNIPIFGRNQMNEPIISISPGSEITLYSIITIHTWVTCPWMQDIQQAH